MRAGGSARPTVGTRAHRPDARRASAVGRLGNACAAVGRRVRDARRARIGAQNLDADATERCRSSPSRDSCSAPSTAHAAGCVTGVHLRLSEPHARR